MTAQNTRPAGSESPLAALARLGLTLPTPAKPVAAYVPTRVVGNLLYISGQIPVSNGQPIAKGLVPREVSIETAISCARQCTLNALAAAHEVLKDRGGLDAVRSVVRVGAFVACEAGFADHPKIANGASELLVEVFGESGKHARAAVGAPSLPLNVPVEIEFLFEVN